jgi:hypothetical protein
MEPSRTNPSKSESSLTPRVKAGKTLFLSAKGDLTAAQRKLDAARALRESARGVKA